jgi:hypothetical protein
MAMQDLLLYWSSCSILLSSHACKTIIHCKYVQTTIKILARSEFICISYTCIAISLWIFQKKKKKEKEIENIKSYKFKRIYQHVAILLRVLYRKKRKKHFSHSHSIAICYLKKQLKKRSV